MLGAMSNQPLLGMTPHQVELMDFIVKFITENRFSPSYDEMRDAMNLASKSGIHRLVMSLSERGCIRVNPNRARSVYPTEMYLMSVRDRDLNILINLIGADKALTILRAAQ